MTDKVNLNSKVHRAAKTFKAAINYKGYWPFEPSRQKHERVWADIFYTICIGP